jgi:hypothetical protein
VSSPTDETKGELVVEFPTLNCTDSSPKKQQMENARQQLLDACGPIISAHWTDLHHAKAYISGVPFFDFGHGKGHPPNGAEIHLALGFRGLLRSPKSSSRACVPPRRREKPAGRWHRRRRRTRRPAV